MRRLLFQTLSPVTASCHRSCSNSALTLARCHDQAFCPLAPSSSLRPSFCLRSPAVRMSRAFAAKASSAAGGGGAAAAAAAAGSSSASSSSSPSSASSEPLRSLDDVTFTYIPPVVEAEEDVKGAKRRAAQERARSKMERGKKRQEERMAKLRTQGQQKLDFSGILPEDNPFHSALSQLPSLSPAEASSLLLTAAPETASARQLRTLRIAGILRKYAKTPADTGSSEVQVAVLTERINSLRAHCRERISDRHSRRSLSVLEEKRRGLLKYLRRRNVLSFEMMMKDCKVSMQEIDGVGVAANSGNQARRVPRSG